MPRSDSKTIWDGQQSTIDATTRAAQNAIAIDQQIHNQIQEIQKQHGFTGSNAPAAGGMDPSKIGPKGGIIPTPTSSVPLPPSGSNVAKIVPMTAPLAPPMMPVYGGMMPPIMVPNPFHPPTSMPQQSDEYGGMPPNKRFRTEDSLENEQVWLAKYGGQIVLSVATPATQDYNLEGKLFKISLEMSSTVAALKQLIQEETSVPTSKAKLIYEGHFMKDNLSLAYYNVINNGLVQLQLKERGGRKK